MRTRGKALVQAVGVRKTSPAAVKDTNATKKRKRKEETTRVAGETKTMSHVLPESLLVLRDVFTGILTVYGMMKKRNKQTSYLAMKEGVESASKRRFDEKMLYQLKTLVPELIELETIPVVGTHRKETTTVVKMSQGNLSPLEAKRRLQSALQEYVSSWGTQTRRQSLLSREVPEWKDSNTHLVPSPEPIEDAIQWISSPGSPVSGASLDKSTESILQSPRKTTMRVRRARRLSFSQRLDSNQPVPLCSTTDNVLDEMPDELRRRSLDGIISVASLKKLDENEREHRRLSGSDARAARSEKAIVKSLPDMFHRVRTIFGRRGPKAIKLDDICSRIRRGGAELTTLDDIAHRVRSLAAHAPEFITIQPWGEFDDTPTVWVNRTCDFSLVFKRISAIDM